MSDDLVLQAEQIVLGSMMLDPGTIDAVTGRLRSTDFADRAHVSIFAAVVAAHGAGAETSAMGTAIALNTVKGELQRVGGAPYLHTLIAAVPTTANATWYADVVADAALARAAKVDGVRLAQIAESGDVAQIKAERARLVESWTRRIGGAVDAGAAELDDFLGDDTTDDHDWRVTGLIERGDRTIVTGPEGGGKSTLLRQIGLQIAAGIHPFTGDDIEPQCVLIVDLENSTAQVRRELRPLRLAAGDRYHTKPGLHLRVRPDGIDLLSPDDGRWLLDLALAIRPDILITGPIYKLAHGDPTEERTARTVTAWLDRIRVEAETALIIEAHTPHGTNGGKRPIRPYGASLWLRWPEFGLYLSPEGHLQHWRGPRDQRDWPAALKRGGAWPWTQVTRPQDLLWAQIVDLCGDRIPGERELAVLTGASKSSIHRAIETHRAEWDQLTSSQVTGGGPDESLT